MMFCLECLWRCLDPILTFDHVKEEKPPKNEIEYTRF